MFGNERHKTTRGYERGLAERETARAETLVLRHAADAEDAAQGALVEILRSASTYRGDSALENWATRITARHLSRTLAKRRRERAAIDDGADVDDLTIDADQEHVSSGLPHELETYLRRYPSRNVSCSSCITLSNTRFPRFMEITGLTLGQVKRRLIQANQNMRRLIRRDHVVGLRLHVR
jgi:RNA polymerase sigma-70 factor (ECF subfamily)